MLPIEVMVVLRDAEERLSLVSGLLQGSYFLHFVSWVNLLILVFVLLVNRGSDIVGGALVACLGGATGLCAAAELLLVYLVPDCTDGGGFS